MGPVKLTSRHKQRISIAAFALAALLLLDGIYQIGMHARWRSWIPTTLAAETPTTQPTDSQPADSQPTDTQPTDTQPAAEVKNTKPPKPPAINAAIKKRNIMTKPKPKGHGMRLTGVLGKVALFTTREGKTVGIEEGKSAQGVKVTAVDGFDVTIEYEGKTETMKLFPEKKTGPTPTPPASMPTSAPRQESEPDRGDGQPQSQPAETTGETRPSSQPAGVKP